MAWAGWLAVVSDTVESKEQQCPVMRIGSFRQELSYVGDGKGSRDRER